MQRSPNIYLACMLLILIMLTICGISLIKKPDIEYAVTSFYWTQLSLHVVLRNPYGIRPISLKA